MAKGWILSNTSSPTKSVWMYELYVKRTQHHRTPTLDRKCPAIEPVIVRDHLHTKIASYLRQVVLAHRLEGVLVLL